jgi:uncharacterized HhH-GPD family protein
MPRSSLHLAQDAAADAVLDRSPLALLIGMLLDQQVPMEKAFAGPYVLTERLGHDLNAAAIAAYDPDRFAALFVGPPAIHRYPAAMAARVQKLCAALVADYGGSAEAVWADASSGAELRARLAALPGFGPQKAQIFLALLGKQLGVRRPGWREAAGPYGAAGTHASVADVTGPESLRSVREHKRAAKAAAKAERK